MHSKDLRRVPFDFVQSIACLDPLLLRIAMASNPDPMSIATEKTILPPVAGKEHQIVSEKQDYSSDEGVVIEVNGDVIKESDYTEEQYKKLLRKIDRFLLPLMVQCSLGQVAYTSLSSDLR